MITNEQVRVDFERWATAHVEHVPLVRIGEFYLSPDASLMWGAWQAARVAGGGEPVYQLRLKDRPDHWHEHSESNYRDFAHPESCYEYRILYTHPATARAGVDELHILVKAWRDRSDLLREGTHSVLRECANELLALISQQGDSRG